MENLTRSELRLFVYGTLKPGYVGFSRYCQAHAPQIQPAITTGRLYHLALGYPALTLEPGLVQGVLLIFPDLPEILPAIDAYEGYDPQAPASRNDYQRLWQPIHSPTHQALGQAWVYVMALEKVQKHHGQWLTEGIWPGKTQHGAN